MTYLISSRCGTCHGNGLDSDERGRDIICLTCGGHRHGLMLLGDLDRQDAEKLYYELGVVLSELPVPLAGL